MRRLAAGMVLAVVAQLAWAQITLASNPPPTPPPPPGCKTCSEPPPPPTLLPTAGPTLIPTDQIVKVTLSPVHVRRGQMVRLVVEGTIHSSIVAVVHYRSGKPVTYHGRVGSDSKFVKTWTIAKFTPVGKAWLAVKLTGSGSSYSTTVSFTVAN